MKILKFGGTSVGSPSRIKKLVSLINGNQSKIIVLSAISGTTNELVRFST
jgi:aspartate kinase